MSIYFNASSHQVEIFILRLLLLCVRTAHSFDLVPVFGLFTAMREQNNAAEAV